MLKMKEMRIYFEFLVQHWSFLNFFNWFTFFFDHVVEFTPIFQHPRIGGPGLVGRYEFPDGYVE